MKLGKIAGTVVLEGVERSFSITEDGTLTIGMGSTAVALGVVEALEDSQTDRAPAAAATNGTAAKMNSEGMRSARASTTKVNPSNVRPPSEETKEKKALKTEPEKQLTIEEAKPPANAPVVEAAPAAEPPNSVELTEEPPANDQPGDGNPEWGLSKIEDELVKCKTFREVILYLQGRGCTTEEMLVQEIDRLRKTGGVPVLTRMSPSQPTADRVQSSLLAMGR